MKNTTILVFITLLPWAYLVGQSSLEAGIFAGGTLYYGELSKKHGATEEIGFGFGAMGRYMFDRNFGIKMTAGIMQLMGSDQTAESNINRDWRFKNDLIEVAAQFEYHPIGRGRRNIVGQFNQFQLSPYISFGAGAGFGDPKVMTPPKDNTLFPEMGANRNYLVVPLSIGLRFDLSKYTLISAEFGKRAVLSDYVDGISKNGTSTTNDWYSWGGIMIAVLLDAQIDRRY